MTVLNDGTGVLTVTNSQPSTHPGTATDHESNVPPTAGRGSGVAAWVEHFQDFHPNESTDSMTRDQLVARHDAITTA